MLLRLVLTAVLLSSGCSNDGPGPGPGATPLPLRAGDYLFAIVGSTLGCNDLTVPQSGTTARTTVSATQSGVTWIIRPASAAGGTFELELSSGSGGGPPFQARGTIRGQMIDAISGRRASFQTVPVSGTLFDSGGMSGALGGQVVFNHNGIISVCPPGLVTFTLEPQPS